MDQSDHHLPEDVSSVMMEEDEEEETGNSSDVATQSQVSSSHADQLERCGRWLLSIPRDDLIALRQTQEYHDFLNAFECLGHVHRRDIARRNRSLAPFEITPEPAIRQQQQGGTPAVPTTPEGLRVASAHNKPANHGSNNNNNNLALNNSNGHALDHHSQQQQQQQHDQDHNNNNIHGHIHLYQHHHWNSFLQHIAADDIVLRVLEFLECHSLIRISSTCYRFRDLAQKSATQRTQDVANARQLNNVMKLLRAKEQIDGVGTGIRESHVRVPILLLSRRVLVTEAGDPEYNGVYYCTGSNGNGFVFTKPRFPEQRVQRTHASSSPRVSPETLPDAPLGLEPPPTSRLESEVAQPGQLLRCIIAKRFSNETILWYLSKEVIASETSEGARPGEVIQVFAFWAKLMVIGDASPDICRYPSQSSILSRHQEGWQALSTTRSTHPPTVELL